MRTFRWLLALVSIVSIGGACKPIGAGRPEPSHAIEAARAGRPIVVAVGWGGKKKLEMPWQPGLTLTSALVVAFPEHTNLPYHLTMRRSGRETYVDVEAIAIGDQPDIPLEPADQIFIAEDLPFR